MYEKLCDKRYEEFNGLPVPDNVSQFPKKCFLVSQKCFRASQICVLVYEWEIVFSGNQDKFLGNQDTLKCSYSSLSSSITSLYLFSLSFFILGLLLISFFFEFYNHSSPFPSECFYFVPPFPLGSLFIHHAFYPFLQFPKLKTRNPEGGYPPDD